MHTGSAAQPVPHPHVLHRRARAYTQINVCRYLHIQVNKHCCGNITVLTESVSHVLQSKQHLYDSVWMCKISTFINFATQKFVSSWVRGLWSHGEEGNVLPIADCTKEHLVWKPCMHEEPVVFLQQAHMFCPIFLSTIPPYIRPVISWVVTVRVHCASALTLLHQPTKGEQ